MKHQMVFLVLAFLIMQASVYANEPKSVSGIYPHLAMFNDDAECGTGAVVPWADRLWAITYGPHSPHGSNDKLYEITPNLEQIIRQESVGGTHANRMIHKESEQLIIGLYFIDKERNVRVVSPSIMPGRMTGNARHLTNLAEKVYFATMEEGLYEVDVETLAVHNLIKDGNAVKKGYTQEDGISKLLSALPGYHGKGFYSGQGRLVYANNGEQGPRVMFDPTVTSGALAEWNGNGDWQLVRRNQFCEVTGPGGISGNEHPQSDPIWAIGWDHKSLILNLLDDGKWTTYRLPKASHAYDGAHGWHTEWPRIRDIGEDSLLMTMHGTFWKFPKTFSSKNSAGIVPRSTYLKVVGDFCNWNGRVVFGCDDSAKSEFSNKRKVKGNLAGPGRSQSNLWFVEPEQLDKFGPLLGRGAVWQNENVKAGVYSDPFLLTGYEHRTLLVKGKGKELPRLLIQVDEKGDGNWKDASRLEPVQYSQSEDSYLAVWNELPQGTWIRLKTEKPAERITAIFHYRSKQNRTERSDDSTTFSRQFICWSNEKVKVGVWSDPFLLSDFEHKTLTVKVKGKEMPRLMMQVDEKGDGNWKDVPRFEPTECSRTEDSCSAVWNELPQGIWARLKTEKPMEPITVMFEYCGKENLTDEPTKKFDGLATLESNDVNGGTMLARGADFKTLRFVAQNAQGELGAYDLDGNLKLQKADDPAGLKWTKEHSAIPVGVLELDNASVLLTDEKGQRWRLPITAVHYARPGVLGAERVCREVATERDLLHAHGTFYELPAENSGGVQKIRPIASHPFRIKDYASYRGMLVLSGLENDAPADNPHIVKSDDGKCSLWCGTIDDLWELGKPHGIGGPWFNTTVKAGKASDPYLMTGYDKKKLELWHRSPESASFRIELDVCGDGDWSLWKTVEVPAKENKTLDIAVDAYWIRLVAVEDAEMVRTVFLYE